MWKMVGRSAGFIHLLMGYLVSELVIVSPPQPYRLSGSPMLRYTSINSSYKKNVLLIYMTPLYITCLTQITD